MKLDAKRHRIRLLATAISRALVATTVALSFLAMLLSPGITSSIDTRVMACCRGHTTGSCSTGLSESSEVTSLGDVAASVHGSSEPAESADEDIIITESSESETRSIAPEDFPPAVSAIRNPCPAECGTCSVTFAWRVRHRDHAALGLMAVHQPPVIRTFSVTDYAHDKRQKSTRSQLRPRAPPAFPA